MSPSNGSLVFVSDVLSVTKPPRTAVWLERRRILVAIVLDEIRGSAMVPSPLPDPTVNTSNPAGAREVCPVPDKDSQNSDLS